MHRCFPLTFVFLFFPVLAFGQANDEDYTKKIRQYTTDKMFLTELVDHPPASAAVPSPQKVLGYIAGTPGKLTYAKDVHRYFRALAKASPRVKVWSMGLSEGGARWCWSLFPMRPTLPASTA